MTALIRPERGFYQMEKDNKVFGSSGFFFLWEEDLRGQEKLWN